jgi:hypothetical protein
MWQPANKAALPSPGDFKYAKKAIDELEDALKDALAALEIAQLRVLALTKDLDERKAWLAPIRKLPSELLSEIFIFGSGMEHLAPVTITEVSRLWRAVVLATPQAWSLIYTNAPRRQNHLVQYVSTFVERSNPCSLHIWIQDDFHEDEDSEASGYETPVNKVLPLLLSSLSRIRCLSIESRQLMTLTHESMPNLTRLWITDIDEDITPFFINGLKFPRLQSIQSTGCPWRGPLSLTSFPPLQELAIRINHHHTWLDVVKNCSNTLRALTLVGHLQWTERVTITFPHLEMLALNDWSNPISMGWSINMVTPALTTYEDVVMSRIESQPHHGDVKSVMDFRCSHLPDLAPYVNLHMIRLMPFGLSYLQAARNLVEQLEQNANLCPALQRAEVYVSKLDGEVMGDDPTHREIFEKFRKVRPGTEVVFTSDFTHMPGSMQESKVRPLISDSTAGKLTLVQCGAGMPCVEEHLEEHEEWGTL